MKCGGIIISLISFILLFLSPFLKIENESLIGKGSALGIFSGIIILRVGEIIRERGEKTIGFPIEEAYFLLICESLEDIECYQNNQIELSRFNAHKNHRMQ